LIQAVAHRAGESTTSIEERRGDGHRGICTGKFAHEWGKSTSELVDNNLAREKAEVKK